jgi:hypothetical protein
MANLEARLQLLEDEQAILDTLHGYGHGLDYGLEDAWIDCWTPDAILDWPGRARSRIGGAASPRVAPGAWTPAQRFSPRHGRRSHRPIGRGRGLA